MKQLTYSFVLIGIVFLFSGCVAEKREYFKIANGGSGNLEVDKAQCEYQAELTPAIPVPNNTDVTINIDNRRGYGSTNYSNVYGNSGRYANLASDSYKMGASIGRAEEARNRKSRLTDLCLRSRGWSWKIIKN